MKIKEIKYPPPLSEMNPNNDNMDIFVETDDCSVYTFVVDLKNTYFGRKWI